VLAAPLVAAFALHAAPASADSISGDQAEAALLAAEVAADARAVHLAELRYEAASTKAEAASAALAADRSALAAAAAEVALDERHLRDAAIDAYMANGTVDPLSVLLDGHVSALLDRQAFLDVATSGVQDALDSLERAERSLSATESTLARQVAAADRALAEAQRARSAVVATLSAEQAALDSVQGRLAVLVAAKQAAAERAQAAATAGLPTPAGVAALAAGPDNLASAGRGPAPPTPQNFYRLRVCESGDNYAEDTGNGYYGAYQFALSTWESLGYSGLPSEAAPAVQDQAARRLQAEDGWRPWPACSAMLGLD
jgi:hypothetical protein